MEVRLNFDIPELQIHGNVSKMVIYKGEEWDPVNPGDTINFFTYINGRPETFSNYKGLQFEFFYTPKDQLERSVYHYRDILTNKVEGLIYTDYEYDEFGNLLSQFQYKISIAGDVKLNYYKKYDYYYSNDTLVVYCKGVDTFYPGHERSEIEYRFLNGRIISETGKKRRYQKNYFYNKDSFLIRQENSFGDGKNYFIYDRDPQNRITRYLDSFNYAGTNYHTKGGYYIKYIDNKQETRYFVYSNNKDQYPEDRKYFITYSFKDDRIIKEAWENFFIDHNFRTDAAGNWFLEESVQIWTDEEGKDNSPAKDYTYRKIEYATTKTVGKKPSPNKKAEELKEKILSTNKDFLGSPSH